MKFRFSSTPSFAPILLAFWFVLLQCPQAAAGDADGLYQYSTINALLGGLYDGNLTIG